MHAQNELLHTVLEQSSVIRHKSRLNSVLKAVDSLTNGGYLSMAGIGRYTEGLSKVKNKIKAVDYLLDNGHLHRERKDIYFCMAQRILNGVEEVIILVDWSPCINQAVHILRASVIHQGRAVTLYEEVHPESQLGTLKIHKKFLAILKPMIPKDKWDKTTIVTDAGFRSEWFSLVESMGLHYVGRILGPMQYKKKDGEGWVKCSSEYENATKQPSALGEVILSKERELLSNLYLYKDYTNIKKPSKKRKQMSARVKKHRKAAMSPWVLASSYPVSQKTALEIINIYRKRMKVEHDFRDTKDTQWGLGLSRTLCVDPHRLQVLLLIGFLAIITLWLIGLMTELQGRHYDYQANTVKSHRVLSLVFLGLQVLFHHPEQINGIDLIKLIDGKFSSG